MVSVHTMKIWNETTGECIKTLYGYKDWVWSVSFNSLGMLASYSDDRTVKIWNIF